MEGRGFRHAGWNVLRCFESLIEQMAVISCWRLSEHLASAAPFHWLKSLESCFAALQGSPRLLTAFRKYLRRMTVSR